MDSAAPLCITLIAVLSEDGFISTGTGVPWDLPADKAHFRAYSAGKWLLLGRKTYEEMLGWFRDHTPLVLTRQEDYTPPVGQCVGTLAEAVALASASGQRELVVCGGSAAYAASISQAHKLILTRVQVNLGLGVPFPLDQISGDWQTVSRQHYAGSPEFEIEVMERKPT